jgi:gluconolactonase
MNRASFPLSKFSGRPGVAGLALLAVLGCSDAGDTDDAPGFAFTPPGQGGSSGTSPAAGVGGSTTPSVGAGGTTSTGAVGNSSEGQGGSVPLGNAGTGGRGAGAGAATNGGAGGVAAGAGGTGTAAGGSGNANGAGPGRVGAESCPPGPFGDPLAGGVTVQPLASVGDNNFFNFEGPVWTGDALFLSEIANDNTSQIDRYTLDGTFTRGFFTNTGSNGLALDENGDLLLAAHDVGGISRLALPEGTITRGSQKRNDQRFNSPNDLVLRGDGNIYFTDPDFQSPSGRIQGGTFVYRIAPPETSGDITIVDQNVDNPNGVTLSPDGNTLYVSANGVLRKYSLDAAGAPTPAGDVVSGFGSPDGMAMDCAGNLYAVQNGNQTITVFSPAGQSLGVIGPNGFEGRGVTNAAFGGPNRTTLFVTTSSQGEAGGLYSIELSVPGFPY